MNELRTGVPRRFRVEGKPVGVVRLDGSVVAFVPFCPHARADLTLARFEGETVCCHWHGWKFNLITGDGLNNDEQLKLFPVVVEEGSVFVSVEEETDSQTDETDFMPEIRWKGKTGD